MKQVVIGSRGSRLALWQSEFVKQQLERRNPGLRVRIEVIQTTGDHISESALAKIGSTKGLFVKEIEEFLLERRVDLAVHSLKDTPAELPRGLCLAAIPEREDARDVLILPEGGSSNDGKASPLMRLSPGAKLGTSSLRRRVQLKHLRSDLGIQVMRGNVDTRIRKMHEQGFHGIVLAAAGVRRLGLQEKIAQAFSFDEMIPAVGQGALAIEIREDDEAIRGWLAPLDHGPTHLCTNAERAFLRKMGGGCQVPMGAHAFIADGRATFVAFAASPDAEELVRTQLNGPPEKLEEMALGAAEELLARGADEMLRKPDP